MLLGHASCFMDELPILIISSEFRSQVSHLSVPEFSQHPPIAKSAPNSGSGGRVGPELGGTVTPVIV